MVSRRGEAHKYKMGPPIMISLQDGDVVEGMGYNAYYETRDRFLECLDWEGFLEEALEEEYDDQSVR